MAFKLKFNYNGVFRRTTIDSMTLETVEKTARELFSIQDSLKVTLTWVDEESDLVYVSSQQEFQEFLDEQEHSGNRAFMRGSLFKLGVVTEANPEPAPAGYSHSAGESVVHKGVACDVCEVCPVVGVRYKCTGRNDYDLCSECEKKCDQPFPLLKMYEPKVGVNIKVRGQGFGPRGGRRGCGQQSDHEAGCVPTPPSFQGPAVHEGVTCNECSVGPIVGVRYKCTVRNDFDLCARCEASKASQPYPMLKICRPDISVQVKGWGTQGKRCPANPFGFGGRNCGARGGFGGRWRCGKQAQDDSESTTQWPRQAAAVVGTVLQSVGDVAEKVMEKVDDEIMMQTIKMSLDEHEKTTSSDHKEEPTKSKASSDSLTDFPAGTVRGYALKPMARFVGDITIPDATVLEPSTDFVKIWLVRNDGPCDWPTSGQGVRLITAGGDPMSLHWDSLSIPVESIKVGEETHISVTLKSPPAPGRYVSYFRLQAADGTVFGQKLWVDIRVQANLGGSVGFTSPAFAVPKEAPQKIPSGDGAESKPSGVATLPITYAKTSAAQPFITPSDDDSHVEMEFPGGEVEEVSPPTPPGPQVSTSEINRGVTAIDADDDTIWEAEKGQLESDWKVELDALRGMGFHDSRENIKLLKKHTKFSFVRFPHLQGKPFSDSLSTIIDALLN